MNKTGFLFICLLIAVPVLFTGCQKSDLKDQSAAQKGVAAVKSTIAYNPCGNQVVATLYEWGHPDVTYGTVTVGNDLTNLYVTYELSGNWLLVNTFLYVGLPEGLPAANGTPSYINPDGTGYFHIGTPPFEQYAPGWPVNAVSAYTKVIPLNTLPDCFVVVAFAGVRDGVSPDAANPMVSAKAPSPFKSYGYYINYCKQVCGSGCETAYAYGNTVANCFIGIPGVTSNNWGWSNGPIGQGTYSWPIYAGAGQCNTANGFLVGTLNVTYAGSVATITYNMGGNCKLNTTHLYVGNQILPKKNGKYTTAPGQFPYKHENLGGVSSDSYTITGLSGNIYIAAHSDVCW